MTQVRQDVWTLEDDQPFHPIVLAYALAVDVLRGRAADDPTGWEYLTAVHGTQLNPDQFRNTCQHNTWFFLPWHRSYLQFFEQMVRDVVATLPEIDDQTKADWALPYWDYGRATATRALPPSFREPLLPDGTPNALFTEEREPLVNQGFLLPRSSTSARFALRELQFSNLPGPGVTPGFGGPDAGRNHFADSALAATGALEGTPHGDVHSLVGGATGWMGDFDTAALDPIFWLHHANIDRLWEVWLTQPGRANPTGTAWLTTIFDFHRADGQPVKAAAQDVLDTVTQLDYAYADLSLPPGPLEARAMAVPPAHPAELVGATDETVELTGGRAGVAFSLSPPAGPLAGAAGGVPSRVYLNVEDIRAATNPGVVYAVYVNAPDGDGDPTNDAHHVGNVSFFGIEAASDPTREHAGGHGGMRFAFDITALYTDLRDRDLWDDRVRVTFEPLGLEAPAGVGRPEAVGGSADPVRVGRVSVYFQ